MRERFVPRDLDFWPLDLKFAALITLVQRYTVPLDWNFYGISISRKSDARDGQTDKRTDSNS